MAHARGAGGSRELDVRYYREEGRPVPATFTFRFRPEKRHTMFYGNSVDLFTLKNLGAIIKLWRDTFVTIRASVENGAWTPNVVTETQYTVEYSVPEEMPINPGKVSLLPANRSNPEFLV